MTSPGGSLRFVKNVLEKVKRDFGNSLITIASDKFFSRVAWLILQDMTPAEAIKKVSQQHLKNSPKAGW
ncbi:unnamed protein product, partial [marine sediment metagenome]